MFETSKDILNWVLALSSAAVAFFICWAIYYLINTFRRGFKLVKKAEGIIFQIEDLVSSIKNKVNSSASYLFMLKELTKKVFSIIKDKKKKKDDLDDDEEFEYEVKTKRRKRK